MKDETTTWISSSSLHLCKISRPFRVWVFPGISCIMSMVPFQWPLMELQVMTSASTACPHGVQEPIDPQPCENLARLHPWKTNMTCENTQTFNRKYILKFWMFYCHVRFEGDKSTIWIQRLCFDVGLMKHSFLVPKSGGFRAKAAEDAVDSSERVKIQFCKGTRTGYKILMIILTYFWFNHWLISPKNQTILKYTKTNRLKWSGESSPAPY